MKKIFFVFILSGILSLVLSFFITNTVLAGHKTDLPVCDYTYTDASGNKGTANAWCAGKAWQACSKNNCGNDVYDFCADNRHYHFGCKCYELWGIGAWISDCRCDSDNAWYEECTGEQGCQKWSCNNEGCSGGGCFMEKLTCPADKQCCSANDSVYKEKVCPLVGQKCENYNCVSQPCPSDYECCTGSNGYIPKECNEGYYCGNNKCLKQPTTLNDCPWQCCVSEKGFKDKSCSGGECINHECVSGSSITGGGITSGGGTSGGDSSFTGILKSPIEAETFDELVKAITNFIFWVAMALAPLLFMIGGIMLVTAGGNPTQVGKAKSLFLYTAIGLVVILLARGLVAVLQTVLGVK